MTPTYPINNHLNADERKALRVDVTEATPAASRSETRRFRVRAVATGADGVPKSGEWYLSEALGEDLSARRASMDFTDSYRLARLVVVERIERIVRP